MRLFVAIEISDAVRQSAEELADELRRRVRRLAPRARVSWVASECLHMTLAFIGQVGEQRAAAVLDALRARWLREPIPTRVAGVGTFPPRGAPRAIWVGVDIGRDALVDVQQEVAARLSNVGIAPEQRPFHPHMTLARVREPAGLRAGPLIDGLADTGLGTFQVGAVTLFESRLSPRGPSYVPLLRAVFGTREQEAGSS
jgi:2'-5' RNA ligase